jgi:hypothetical protein
VDRHRDLDGGVADDLPGRVWRRSKVEQERDAGMAEIMESCYLQTHLTAEQVGDRLFVSRHTVKTQVRSTYRKLGVSPRNDAVQKRTTLGPARRVTEVTARTTPVVQHIPTSGRCRRLRLHPTIGADGTLPSAAVTLACVTGL